MSPAAVLSGIGLLGLCTQPATESSTLGHRDTGQLGPHWRAVMLGSHARRAFTAQERSSKGFGGVLGPGTMGGWPVLGSWLGCILCSGRHVRVVLGPHVCLCVRDVSATETQR